MKPLDEEGRNRATEAFKQALREAERYSAVFPEHAEDIESSAAWGAVRAASSFVPEEGVWDHWKSLCSRGEIRNFLDTSYLKRRVLWTQDQLERVEAQPVRTIWEEEDAAEHMIGLLPPSLREICRLVYISGVSPYSAGQMLGMSGDHGCRLHRRAIDHLRQALAA